MEADFVSAHFPRLFRQGARERAREGGGGERGRGVACVFITLN